MPAELTTSVILNEAVTIPERKAEVIDIVGTIIINTDEHKVDFTYVLYEYQRDANGNVLTNADGKKLVKRVSKKSMTVCNTDYDTAFSELPASDIPLGKAIELKLIDWVKTHDTKLSGIDITYIDSSNLDIK